MAPRRRVSSLQRTEQISPISVEYVSGNMGKRLTWNKSSNGVGAGVVTAKARSLMGAYMGGSSMKSCLDSLKGLAGS
ncbi:hypothetical protein Q3G72_010614 [Acer saccharum]|nr:hypothetical protein Q3G72_010614 [Acer saccharum]